MPTILVEEEFPRPTSRSQLVYRFTPKHHDGHDPDAARWLPELTHAEEFAVFELADDHAIADDEGNLYGLLRGDDGEVRTIGTWRQQYAEFPVARPGEPWHGYPLGPVDDDAPDNRRGDACKPAKVVFSRMFAVGLIDSRVRRRWAKGRPA